MSDDSAGTIFVLILSLCATGLLAIWAVSQRNAAELEAANCQAELKLRKKQLKAAGPLEWVNCDHLRQSDDVAFHNLSKPEWQAIEECLPYQPRPNPTCRDGEDWLGYDDEREMFVLCLDGSISYRQGGKETLDTAPEER